ncbi:hypothetical protein J1N35_040931 [Gossypium stocksii]|uniref:Uncharacterized protein n=1 Tax=Gossypium stocksii TaxID=47602 RepID=A0A9D3UF61_9ROSI|nr:hypothetical protein J1N35_040931 [Gossypium stocksii]
MQVGVLILCFDCASGWLGPKLFGDKSRDSDGDMDEGGSSKVVAKVPAGNERVATSPKFKRRKVSAIQDFLPGYERATASNFVLNRQIAIDQSSQGK